MVAAGAGAGQLLEQLAKIPVRFAPVRRLLTHPFPRAADVARDGCLAAMLITAALVRTGRPVGDAWSSVFIVFHVAG